MDEGLPRPRHACDGHALRVARHHSHLGVGRPVAKRERVPVTAPETLEEPEQRQFLRAAQKCGSVRDTAIALLLLLYTGLRVEKVHHLDLIDVPISARRGKVIVRAGKGEHGGIYREVPMHHAAREALRAWLHERANHRGAATPALFLNRLGGRLLARSIRTIIAELGPCRRPGTRCRTRRREVPGTPHTLGHTVATQLLRNGVDIVTVADIMGHARIDTVRLYTRSSEADRARAIEKILITDE